MTFFFIALFTFLVFWRPQDWLWPWMYGWPILDVIIVASLVCLIHELNSGSLRLPKEIPQLKLLVGLWLAALMSHVANTYLAGFLFTIEPVFKICFFTYLLFVVLDRPERLRKLAWIVLAMTCVMAVHAIMQERTGYGFMGQPQVKQWRPVEGIYVYRSLFFGIFEDPNDLAQMLATAIPFGFILTKRKSFLNLLIGCATAYFLIIALLATKSRGGYIALSSIGLVFVLLSLPAKWLPKILPLSVISALFLCTFAAPYLDASAHDRVVFWGDANFAFKHHLFFGVGYDMFGEYVEGSRASHNAYVACYTELGLFGYWFWFTMLQLAVVGTWRTRIALTGIKDVDAQYLRRFAGMGLAAMAGFASSAYFLSRTFIYPFFILFAMLGVLPWLAQKYLPADRAPIINVRRDVLKWGTIGSVGSVVYIYISILLLNKAWGG